MKLNHHDKKISGENPVGPEFGEYRFDVPLWKVFVTLFLIAIVLTAFKYYERHHIAPHQTVAWKAFDLKVVKQEQLRRRNLMIKVNKGQDEFLSVFEDPIARAAVYLDKTICLQIDAELGRETAIAEWLAENTPEILDGGVCFTRSDGSPFQCAKWNELTAETINNWIDP